MVSSAYFVIEGCWIVFMVWWLVAAFGQKAAAERQSLGSAALHRVPVIAGAVFLFVRDKKLWGWPWSIGIVPQTEAARWLGAGVCACGLAFCVWARIALAGNWSSNVTFKQGHELVRRGPYRVVRHPIYTGLLTMGLGNAIAGGQLHCWFGVLLWAAGFWIKLKQEETLLLRHFPGEYPAYCQRVKALVPFVL